MGKYTSDDNRSMQLNENNDRYYSSRGIDRYDDDDDPAGSYQMQMAEINRQIRQEDRWKEAENMEWACPHGCHERSNYYSDQYKEYVCYHRETLLRLPRLIRELEWAEEHEPKRKLWTYKCRVRDAMKVLEDIPYIPGRWNVGYKREDICADR